MSTKQHTCEYVHRERGAIQVFCTKLIEKHGGKLPSDVTDRSSMMCAHQYYCGVTGQCECTANADNCPLRK